MTDSKQNENGVSVRDLVLGIGVSRVSIGGVERIDPDAFFIAPRDMTTGEAEAWRKGWEAARAAAAMRAAMEGVAGSCQAEEAEPDSPGAAYQQGRADAALRIVKAIRAMDPSAREGE